MGNAHEKSNSFEIDETVWLPDSRRDEGVFVLLFPV